MSNTNLRVQHRGFIFVPANHRAAVIKDCSIHRIWKWLRSEKLTEGSKIDLPKSRRNIKRYAYPCVPYMSPKGLGMLYKLREVSEMR